MFKISQEITWAINFKLFSFFLLLVSLTFCKPLLLFIFPGILFFYLPISKRTQFFEMVIFSVIFSLSFWICGFWLLKFIPLDFSKFIYFISGISLIISFLIQDKYFYIPKLTISDIISFLFTSVLFFLFLPLYTQQIAPAGADMATQTYMARLIQEKNSFPDSYEPILSMSNFGLAPFGFSVITAGISLLNNLPIYRSSLLLTTITYPLLGTILFIFLKRYFNLFVSILATLTFLFIGEEITSYITWGGNTTIFSIMIFITSLVFYLSIKEDAPKKIYALVLTILLYASFTSHHIPFITLFYYVPVALIFFTISSPKKVDTFLKWLNFHILLLALLLIFSVPFFLCLKIPSHETLEWIKNWHEKYWQGNWKDAIKTIPIFIEERIGNTNYLFLLVGMFTSIIHKLKHKEFFLISLPLIPLIILNSRYWFLPLSPLLYPDRILTIGMIPISYFFGAFYYFIFQVIKKISDIYPNYFYVSIIMLFLLISKLFFSGLDHRLHIIKLSAELSSITQDDVNAFNWISLYTDPSDIFLNNYGDAGIWMPAIAYRKVVVNDAEPYFFDELKHRSFGLKPTYAYIGSKVVYENGISITSDALNQNPLYQLVYSSGDARVYKIIHQQKNL